MVNDRPRLGFIKYCRGYFLNRKKRKEEKRKNSCRGCKNLLINCKCKRSGNTYKNGDIFKSKAMIWKLNSDESLNNFSQNGSDIEDLNSLKAESCQNKWNQIKNTNF
jgi:hypothetical protein